MKDDLNAAAAEIAAAVNGVLRNAPDDDRSSPNAAIYMSDPRMVDYFKAPSVINPHNRVWTFDNLEYIAQPFSDSLVEIMVKTGPNVGLPAAGLRLYVPADLYESWERNCRVEQELLMLLNK